VENFADIDALKLLKGALNALFPKIRFFLSPDSAAWSKLDEEADIYVFARKRKIDYENKKMLAMEMSKSEKYKALFPNDASGKGQIFDKLDAQSGRRGGVMKLGMEIINEKYIHGFNSVAQEEIKIAGDDFDAAACFESEVFKDRTYLIEDFTDIDRAKEIFPCDHSVSSIYKAFGCYAHKRYTLIRLAREFSIGNLYGEWKSDLEDKIKKADKSSNYWGLCEDRYYANFMENFEAAYGKLNKNMPAVELGWDMLRRFFVLSLKRLQNIKKNENTQCNDARIRFIGNAMKLINKILESIPEKYKLSRNDAEYIPTDFITLAGQICGQLGHIKTKSEYDSDFFTNAELANIKNYWNALVNFLDGKHGDDIEECIKFGNCFDKVKLLHSFAKKPSCQKIFPKKSIEIIEGLRKKISDGSEEHGFRAGEKSYNAYMQEQEGKKQMEQFICLLKRQFAEGHEQDFMAFVSDERNWSVLAGEFGSYYEGGSKNTNSALFLEYKKNRKNVPHSIFSHKIMEALAQYDEWRAGKHTQRRQKMEIKLDSGFKFINGLLLKHRVSLRALSDFADAHMGDLQQAESIFDLKEKKDGKLCLALFRLMAGEYAAAISERFCSRYSLDPSLDDFFFEKNKLFLLAAFVYNPSFFAMSWNLCGIIRSELALRQELQEKTPKHETGFAAFAAIRLRRNAEVLAASSADAAMKEIWSEDIAEGGVFGRLRIMANNKDNAGKVQFRFKFRDYHSEPPFDLLVRYSTKSDGIEHAAELNTTPVNCSRSKELVIASAPQSGVRYSGGLSGISLEARKRG